MPFSLPYPVGYMLVAQRERANNDLEIQLHGQGTQASQRKSTSIVGESVNFSPKANEEKTAQTPLLQISLTEKKEYQNGTIVK